MYFSWAWQSPETLLGILTATGIGIQTEDETYTVDMVSIGVILFRIDFLINKRENDD
jgi:hypothetical protein